MSSTATRARRTDRLSRARTGGAGERGLALVPPAYGIGGFDFQPGAQSGAARADAVAGQSTQAAAPEHAEPGLTVPGQPQSAAAVELLMPEPPAGPTAAEQQRLQQVQRDAGAAAHTQREMPPAADAVDAARAAVDQPPQETESLAQAQLIAELRARAEPSPEILALCERIQDAIRNRRPTDEDTLMEADPQADAEAVGEQLQTQVQGNVDSVEQSYQEVNQTPQPGEPATGEPLATPPPSVESPAIDAQRAAPDEPPAEQLSLAADVAANAGRMEAAGMNSAAAQLVQSGPIAEAREAQDQLQQTAERDPAQVLADLNAARAGASATMLALQAQALSAMRGSRAGTATDIGAGQRSMVETEQQMRVRVSAEAESVFLSAQERVNALLEPLVREAMERWNTEVAILTNAFERDLGRVQGWIEERYAGVGGAVVELVDAVFSMPAWITRAYDRAEQRFADGVCRVLREISLDVNSVILACETIIEDTDREIARLYSELPDSLREWAEGERARFSQQLQELHTRVIATRNQFSQQISSEAAAAVQQARQRVEQLREAARGILERGAAAIAAFLEDPARAIIDGLLELVGIAASAFWALLERIDSVIADIAADPLGFANNLVSALGRGFRQFFDRFGTHLLGGFFDWLFSGLGAVGVNIPTDFSLSSIVTFFLELMGITWDRVRNLMARHIGEENIALLEQAYELIATLIEQGPRGIFEMLREQFNPQTILDQVKQSAIDFVVEVITTQVAARLLAMFNPAGAILTAVELIYRVLRWVFENAASIFSLVETVVNGAAELIAGNLGGMANAIEGALGRLVAPVIDFIAGYFGLGNLPERIADTIRGFQEWIEGILDRVIRWFARRARGLLSALGGRSADGADGGRDTELGETQNFAADGERHSLWVEHNGRGATVMLASTPAPLVTQLRQWRGRLEALGGQSDESRERRRPRAEGLLTEAETLLTEADTLSDTLAADWQTYMRGRASGSRPPPDDNTLEVKERQLVAVLRQLFELFGESAQTGADIDSRIVHRTRNLQGHQVGIEMVADPLTKNHPVGSEPRTGVQDGLMNQLSTATSGLRNNEFFLRGHLLNHHVGGVGTAENLFPITGEANRAHLNRIETRVKDWVDDERVVYYKVSVTVDGIDLSHDSATAERRLNFVNARFNVEARANATENDPAESVSPSSIVSRFSPPSEQAYLQANGGQGREEFRITERVRGKTEAGALAELMLLNQIGEGRARSLYEKVINNENIGTYRAVIGISKSVLDEANPNYRIVW